MKAQNFSFMKKLVPKILNGTKILTNRVATDFRGKLNVGGIMHLCTGIRTKNYQKICDAKVLMRFKWYNEWIPTNRTQFVPMFEWITWRDFAKLDGFDDYDQFVKFFSHKRYEIGIYCYQFEVINFE